MANDQIHEQLAWLARGPANSILMYQGYEINGYTFHTRSKDNKSNNQNSGVHIDVIDTNGQRNSYTIIIAAPHQAEGLMTCWKDTKTPRG